tara:strand:+ start:173 stop:403 length:231 start_codon:yes stop_codon:yes gene_type:complete
MFAKKKKSFMTTKEKIIRNYIDSGEHVFISLTPTIGEAFSAEGVIKRLDANGWFQLEFMGSINGFHINQVENIVTD